MNTIGMFGKNWELHTWKSMWHGDELSMLCGSCEERIMNSDKYQDISAQT